MTVRTREDVIRSFHASEPEVAELLRYCTGNFDPNSALHHRFPLADEACAATWDFYESEVTRKRSLSALYRWLPQLQFPLQENLSVLPEYVAATTQGRFIYPQIPASGIRLAHPENCRIVMHQTPAGRIPVIVTGCRADFVSLIRAFLRKGEPYPVPDSMGAVIIGGYNNLHRIQMLREKHLTTVTSGSWSTEFTRIREQKELYQDRFIILSCGSYSGVEASKLSVSMNEWNVLSHQIRLEHECTHYFTRRVFGSMQNNLLDELLADYCGIDLATGTYHSVWALYFLGLENSSEYRNGGRLENYRGVPALSSGAFRVLQRIVRSAVTNLESFNQRVRQFRENPAYRAASIFSISSMNLDKLASEEAVKLLLEQYLRFSELLRE